jgi:hypothetical protein
MAHGWLSAPQGLAHLHGVSSEPAESKQKRFSPSDKGCCQRGCRTGVASRETMFRIGLSYTAQFKWLRSYTYLSLMSQLFPLVFLASSREFSIIEVARLRAGRLPFTSPLHGGVRLQGIVNFLG